jgi:SAM-dependent methyltransferase
VAEVFDREAVRYDAWFDSPEGRALFQSEVEAVRLLLKDLPGPVLEVGVLLIVTLCFSSPLPLLREAKRVLRPDGALIIADILRDSAWGRWYLEKRMLLRSPLSSSRPRGSSSGGCR